MFFFIFIFFSYKCFPANSLSCMTSRSIFYSPCTFSFGINDVIPDNTKLLEGSTTCLMGANDFMGIASIPGGSCYAEVTIDYQTKNMSIELTHVSILKSSISPYDDMFGFANGIRSVIQYKINGNLEKDVVALVTRVQCATYDDCAFDKLRALLPNLTKPETRLTTFKNIATLLNTPDKDQGSSLKCMNGNDVEPIDCSDNDHKCKFENSKDVTSEMSCATPDTKENYDIEYRFNVIEEMETDGSDTSEKAWKLSYLCKRNSCNSEHFIEQVIELLDSFVFSSSIDNSNTNDGSAASQSQQQNHKNNGPNSTSFYYRSTIIFFLFIQILSN